MADRLKLEEYLLYLFTISLFISIASTEIILGVLILFLILKVIRGEIRLRDFKFGLIFLLFIFFVDFSLGYKFFILKSMKIKIKKFFGGWLFFSFYVGYFLINSEKIRDRIYKLMIYTCAFSALWGVIYLEFFLKKFHPELHIENIGARGFYSHSLTSSNIWAMILIISIFFLYQKFSKMRLLSSILIFLGILFSFRRGPLLYFLITFWILNFYFLKKRAILINIFILLVIIISLFSIKSLRDRMNMFLNFKNNPCSSFGIRIFLWKNTLNLIKKYPLTGVPIKFKDEMKKLTNLKCRQRGHPHNGFLTIIAYYGFPAFIIFLYLFIRILKEIIPKMTENRWAALGFFLVLTYLLESLTENNFGDSEVKLVFWYNLGIIFSILDRKWNFQ